MSWTCASTRPGATRTRSGCSPPAALKSTASPVNWKPAILLELAERVAAMGFGVVGSNIDEPGSVRIAERFGFREMDW